MKLKIICVTYEQGYLLKTFINSIKAQTNPNWELIIIHDGKAEAQYDNLIREEYMSPKIRFIQTEERKNDYGHSLRELGIKEYVTDEDDWVLITNGDNYYAPVFLQYCFNAIESLPEGVTKNYDCYLPTGVVYFDMVHSHNRGDSSSKGTYGFFNTDFKPCMCDIGSFIVRADIAKEIGFPWRDHDADAHFIEKISELQNWCNSDDEKAFSVIKIPKTLMVHN